MSKRSDQNIMDLASELHLVLEGSMQGANKVKKTLDILKLITDAACEGVIVLDRKGYVRYTNEKHGCYLGLSRDRNP